MTRTEKRSLIILLSVGVAGHLARGALVQHDQPPGEILLDPAGDGDPLAHRDSSIRLAAPLSDGERVDADRASAEELGRVPGIGPSLAKRIVADRESHGGFGGLAGLDRVDGVGPGTLARLAPRLTFSGVPADASASSDAALIDPNAASLAELERLPGIGAARARAIAAFRDSAGPFRSLDDLKRVPGVTASLLARIAPRLRGL